MQLEKEKLEIARLIEENKKIEQENKLKNQLLINKEMELKKKEIEEMNKALKNSNLNKVNKLNEESLIGNYDWCHDGKNKNGDIVLKKDNTVGSKCGWRGDYWKITDDDCVEIKFNGILHKMRLNENKLTLIEPKRNPQSVAVKNNQDEVKSTTTARKV